MNYEPNTVQWRRWDIILHDADEKSPRMLMQIVGFTREGLVKCQYVDLTHPRKVYINELKYLHDPRLFKIKPDWGLYPQRLLENTQDAWKSVQVWNFHYQPGKKVIAKSPDGEFVTITLDKAFMGESGDAIITLQKGGQYLLKCIDVPEWREQRRLSGGE